MDLVPYIELQYSRAWKIPGEDVSPLSSPPLPRAYTKLAFVNINSAALLCYRYSHPGAPSNAGAEVGVASTKAYASQKVVLNMMALAISEDSRMKSEQRMQIIDDLAMLPDMHKSSCTAMYMILEL